MFSNKLSKKLATLKSRDEWNQLTLQHHRVIQNRMQNTDVFERGVCTPLKGSAALISVRR